ncbi:MAG: hypothetical protein WC943_11915 [Elusimicrobiota bacterium]
MTPELAALTATAAGLGAVHTLLGPDHTIPFMAMAKARGWTVGKTARVTLLCGLGHTASGVLLGLAGIGLGAAAGQFLPIEKVRGELAGWMLLGFGAAYTAWGLRKAWSGSPHTHGHGHAEAEHEHPHGHPGADITLWVLFTVVIFGPCEPLIPVVMYPALAHSWTGMALVVGAFSAATIGTMLALVLLGQRGLSLVSWKPLERWTHALAGGAVLACGICVVFLGL